MTIETVLRTLESISSGANASRKLNIGFAIIHKQANIKFGNRQGRLVWDYLVFNELTFVDEKNGEHFSLGLDPSDKKMENIFNELVERYGINSENLCQKIIIRDYQSDDAAALADIIITTWGFNEFSSNPEAIKNFGYTYLHNCLIYCSKTYVAVDGGKPVGIIIGTDIRKKGFHPSALARTIAYGAACLADHDLRKAAEIWIEYNRINENMDKVVQREAEGEITLFILSPKCRGKGIGKKLYSELMKYFRTIGVLNTYVHTDTACNYGFYLAQGMKIRLEEQTSFSYAGTKDVKVFVLTGQASEDKALYAGVDEL